MARPVEIKKIMKRILTKFLLQDFTPETHGRYHNNLRHSPISLEERISTKDWKMCVFGFILELVEVNARLAVVFFTKSPTMNQLEF